MFDDGELREVPIFQNDEEADAWIEEHGLPEISKVAGIKWKPCDDKVHWELEQYYQKTIKEGKLGVKMMASEVRDF